MSLFGSIFGNDGSRAARLAGRDRLNGLNNADDRIDGGYDKARTATNTGYDQGIDYTNTGYDTATGNVNQGYTDATGHINTGYDQSQNYLDQGYQLGDGFLSNAGNEWQTEVDRGQAGLDRYDILTGSQGGQAGLDAFHNSVDYLNSRTGADYGTQALLRAGAGQGQIGRMQGDLATYMSQYDQGILNNARQSLMPYFGHTQASLQGLNNNANLRSDLAHDWSTNSATNSVGRGTALGNLDTAHAGQLSDLATGRAGRLTDLATGRGGDLSSLRVGEANARAGIEQGIGNSRAQTRQDRFAADAATDKNWFNLLQSGVKTGIGFI